LQEIDVVWALPYVLLHAGLAAVKDSPCTIAAQNMHDKLHGAYTGEISATMLAELGVKSTLIGHSERRQYFAETDASVFSKTKTALEQGFMPIVCIGETLGEREKQKTFEVITRQLHELYCLMQPDTKLVIAYEPVWAIGTGKTASKEQAQEVHHFIRGLLAKNLNETIAQSIRILYGGSVTPGNAAELLSQPDIDGALVGGASLKAADFAAIIA
jgi:triosephosphate isomerase